MALRRFLCVSVACALLVTGCDHTAVPPQGNQSAAAVQALPRSVANPPETINLPRRFPPGPPVRASWRRQLIDLSSTAQSWRGRTVSIYYVPPQNTSLERGAYTLQSTMNIQMVAQTTIRPDGSWSTTWDTKGYRFPGNDVFLLVRTNDGQTSLIHLPKRGV